MVTAQRRIVQEIIIQYMNDPEVIGIRLFGSVGRQEERLDSDIDIEIIKKTGKGWHWQKKIKCGITIDFITSSKRHILYQFKRYPYLCFIDLHKYIIYDPTGLLNRMRIKIKKYMEEHPNVLTFWNKQYSVMRERKAKGIKQMSLLQLFDKAEIKFSCQHKITRGWFKR